MCLKEDCDHVENYQIMPNKILYTLANHISDRGLYQNRLKNSYNSGVKRQITQLKTEQRIWIDTSQKKKYKWLLSTGKGAGYH